jgi:hypothetical protein
MIHFFEIFLNAKYKSFNADSSFGNDPLFLLTLLFSSYQPCYRDSLSPEPAGLVLFLEGMEMRSGVGGSKTAPNPPC